MLEAITDTEELNHLYLCLIDAVDIETLTGHLRSDTAKQSNLCIAPNMLISPVAVIITCSFPEVLSNFLNN